MFRTADGRNFGLACATYAVDHDGRFPSSVEEVSAYCAKEHLALTGTNQFEMVFKGSPNDLKLPRGTVAVFREREAWRAPNGKMARIYVMADGSKQTILSDDDFQAWEAEHIIAR